MERTRSAETDEAFHAGLIELGGDPLMRIISDALSDVIRPPDRPGPLARGAGNACADHGQPPPHPGMPGAAPGRSRLCRHRAPLRHRGRRDHPLASRTKYLIHIQKAARLGRLFLCGPADNLFQQRLAGCRSEKPAGGAAVSLGDALSYAPTIKSASTKTWKSIPSMRSYA